MIEYLPPTHVVMSSWNIVVIDHDGEIIEKFFGYCHNSNTYRISSQILEYDPVENKGRTMSGSTYKFLDQPGELHPLAQKFFDILDNSELATVSLKYEISKN